MWDTKVNRCLCQTYLCLSLTLSKSAASHICRSPTYLFMWLAPVTSRSRCSTVSCSHIYWNNKAVNINQLCRILWLIQFFFFQIFIDKATVTQLHQYMIWHVCRQNAYTCGLTDNKWTIWRSVLWSYESTKHLNNCSVRLTHHINIL